MSKTMLVVDDSRFVFEEMKHLLENTGYEIAGYASSGEEALQVYPKLLPDLVTMDIIMPGMDGLEASEHLLQKYPQAKILIVSSLAYDETMDKAKEIGAKGFVFKPFDREQLVAALDEAVKG